MTRAQGKHREFSLNQSVATLNRFTRNHDLAVCKVKFHTLKTFIVFMTVKHLWHLYQFLVATFFC